MDKISLFKSPIVKMISVQFLEIVIIEFTILICYCFLEFKIASIVQIVFLPIIFYLFIAKHTKSVTDIIVDLDQETFYLRVNYFIFLNKEYNIPVRDLKIQIRYKWLLNFYFEVIEIKKKNKTVAVIPEKLSIWSSEEFNEIKRIARIIQNNHQHKKNNSETAS